MWSWLSFIVGFVVGILFIFGFSAVLVGDERRWWE